MNFSGYFCLVAAAVLVVFSQQSEANAILKKNTNCSVDPFIKIKEGFFNGTQMLSRSKSKILDGVFAAEKIVGKNPEGAKKLTQKAYGDGQSIIYTAGPSFFETLGEAFGISNAEARQGLFSAVKYIQKGGLALLTTLKSGQSLFNDGSNAGGRAAKASLNVYHSAIETGFAGIFYDIKKSANESYKALRGAHSLPIQIKIKNRSCGAAAKGDPEGSETLENINQVANHALRNGANPALVQELKEIVKCALDSFVKIKVDAYRVLANIKTIAKIDTSAAATVTSKEAEGFEKRINQLYAELYLTVGDVCVRSGNQSDKEVQLGYVVLEKGNVKIINLVKFADQIIVNGLQNGPDASKLALQTVAKSTHLAKLLFNQSLVGCAKIIFKLL